MKPVKWTIELVTELSKSFSSPSDFKKANPSAYKALRRYRLHEVLYPLNNRQRKPKFTKEELLALMKKCSSRSDFQMKYPSEYNAARRLNIVNIGLPISKRYDLFGRLPYTNEELIATAKKYSSIMEWEEKESGALQVARRKGISAEFGPAPRQGTSTTEIEILEALKTLSVDFKTKRFLNDYELDCYSESLKIGIEYNGFYWHSDLNKPRSYHISKTKYFEEKGIRLIHIWEHEWKTKKAQVISYLRSACGKNTNRIGARKCKFEEIPAKSAKMFLNETHIQGAPSHVSYAIGCYYKGILVGVCTFGLHHRNSNQIVLNRFACLENYTISGFLAKASKLGFNKFQVPIYSWADRAKSQGKGYIASGWKLLSYGNSDYFYATKYGVYVSKQSRKKSNVNTPKEMTEIQHARADGLYRIWDCGKILLVYDPRVRFVHT